MLTSHCSLRVRVPCHLIADMSCCRLCEISIDPKPHWVYFCTSTFWLGCTNCNWENYRGKKGVVRISIHPRPSAFFFFFTSTIPHSESESDSGLKFSLHSNRNRVSSKPSGFDSSRLNCIIFHLYIVKVSLDERFGLSINWKKEKEKETVGKEEGIKQVSKQACKVSEY